MHKHHKHNEAKHSQHGASGSTAEVKAPEPHAHNQTPAEDDKHASPGADSSTKLQWANLGLQTIILAVTAAILWVYYLQLQSMLSSNELTRQSLRETRESNASSSKAAERALKLTEESNRITREALEENKRQSEASRKQSEASRTQSAHDAAASLRLARKSLDESRKAQETTERADLVLDHYDVPDTSPPTTATVYIRNAGRLTAADVRWSILFTHWGGSVDLPKPERIDSAFWKQNNPRTVLGSGATLRIDVRFQSGQEQYPEMRFLHGLIQYLDGFGHERELLFCVYSNRWELGGAWRPCYGRNEVK